MWEDKTTPPDRGCSFIKAFDLRLAIMLDRRKWGDFSTRCLLENQTRTQGALRLKAESFDEYWKKIAILMNGKSIHYEQDKMWLYLENYPSLYFSYLGKLSLSVSGKNIFLTENLMKKIVTLNSYYYWISIESHFVPNITEYKKNMIKTLSYIMKNLKDSKLKEIFISSFYNVFGNEVELSKISNYYEKGWSLVEIRKMILRRDVGQFIPSFWFLQLISRSSLAEGTSFLREAFSYENLPFIDPLDYWLFKFYLPQGGKVSVVIENQLKELKKRTSPEVRYMLVDISENVGVRKLMKWKMPYFSLRRSLFKSFLEEGSLLNLSLLSLVALGEKDSSLLEKEYGSR